MPTQDFKLVSVDPRKEYIFTELPIQVLKGVFEDAGFIYIHHTSNGSKPSRNFQDNVKASREARLFIQGTGLEVFLNHYALDYNPEILREKFYEIFKIQVPGS